VDLNQDGFVDILSGSYSRQDRNMAGLFQVLWGKKGGAFEAPKVLNGTDGKPLIITSANGDEGVLDRICTRPFAADLNGDGHLDIVCGNFWGGFVLFLGEGKGRFAPKSTRLQSASGFLCVSGHGDPCVVDWDGDGDLDIVSGSAKGGALLFENTGTPKAPSFADAVTLVRQPTDPPGTRIGDAHIKGPGSDTRVWVADVNGDGKLDLLMGDSVTLYFAVEGKDPASVKESLDAWDKKREKTFSELGGSGTPEGRKAFSAANKALMDERDQFVRQDRTGFVWVLYRK
jgi:hypothetical protein